MSDLTHFDNDGNAIMVDVTDKAVTTRTAVATGKIIVCPEIFARIKAGEIEKGDVLGVARIAGIMGAKKTSELIPLCHPLPLTKCSIDFAMDENASAIITQCTVKTDGKTGVEMEALTAVSTACLTVYDMCKAVQRDIVIERICLLHKEGGVHGDFNRE